MNEDIPAYQKLQDMEMAFVEGVLERRHDEVVGSTIGYTVTFEMSLDFTHFVQMANAHIPEYLRSEVNAIRPELMGLAYHYSYNYFAGSAGNIGTKEDLFDVFTSAANYLDIWGEGALWRRYGKPEFAMVKGKLQVTARQDFCFPPSTEREIQIADLPIIQFQWALNLMRGHTFQGGLGLNRLLDEWRAPASIVILGYAQADLVPVGEEMIRRDALYMNGKELTFGRISPEQILKAG